jgi:hypothetical protein
VYSALEHICQAVLFVCPPTLLIVKFIWPQRISWWLVLFVVLASSAALGIALDHLGPLAHFEGYDSCSQAMAPGPAEVDCGPFTYDVWTIPIYMKWIPGLVLLTASLPFYGLAIWVRSRRGRTSAT